MKPRVIILNAQLNNDKLVLKIYEDKQYSQRVNKAVTKSVEKKGDKVRGRKRAWVKDTDELEEEEKVRSKKRARSETSEESEKIAETVMMEGENNGVSLANDETWKEFVCTPTVTMDDFNTEDLA
jgi:hypothetical protein